MSTRASGTEHVAYWISPTGEVREVRRGGEQRTHAQWMRTYEGISGDEAENRGWHRVVFEPQPRPYQSELSAYGRVPMTEAQDAALTALAATHGAPRIHRRVRPVQ